MSLQFCDYCEEMFDPEDDDHISECPDYSEHMYNNHIDNLIDSERGK